MRRIYFIDPEDKEFKETIRGIYFIDPDDEEFKETIKNARKKLETPMAPAMPCKTRKKSIMMRPVARLMISSLNLRVSWKPVNPQERVWKKLYQNIMRTILQEKETFHCSIKIPAAKAAVDKEWEKLEKIPGSMKQGRRA